LKTSNLLLSNKGILKLCDFGLVRHYGTPLGRYTQPVVTLWYRAPELLLGQKYYSREVDMWSVGCVFAELLTKTALIKGQNELDQLDKMFKILGTPTEDDWPGFKELPHAKKMSFTRKHPSGIRQKIRATTTEAGFELLMKLLAYDPSNRISAAEALQHRYFTENPLPREPGMIQTHPSLHEGKKPPRKSSSERSNLFGGADREALAVDAQSLGIDPYGAHPSGGFRLKF